MIEVDAFTFTYPGSTKATLQNFSLRLSKGEVLLLQGSSGSGKSTVLKALCGVIPHSSGGEISGHIDIDGINPRSKRPHHLAGHISYLPQNPSDSFVSEYVEEELAFSPIQLGWSTSAIEARIEYCSNIFGINHLRSRRVETLSGGEAQKVAIAAALTSRPQLLLLDEPTSALDTTSRINIIKALKKFNDDENLTIVLAEHRHENLSDFVTKNFSFDDEEDYSPIQYEKRSGELVAEAKNLSFSFNDNQVFSGLSFQCFRGEITTLVGPNGSGKSTALAIAAGLLHSEAFTLSGVRSHKVAREKIGYVPQRPSDLFLFQSVREELRGSDFAHSVLNELNPEISLDSHPRDLSEGEKLALAVAIATTHQPELLILDEPTRGLDKKTKNALKTFLSRTDSAVLIASHENDLISELSDHYVLLNRSSA